MFVLNCVADLMKDIKILFALLGIKRIKLKELIEL